jgi:hypothetical protein
LNWRAGGSIEKERLGGGTVNGGVAAGGPAGAVAQECAVVNVTEKNRSARGLCLGVAFDAQIVIALHEHFGIDRTVRVMADGAAFAQRRVLENERASLFAMTLGAVLVLPRHGQAARRLHDIHPVRIVALHAIHFAFNHRMVLRQVKFSPGFLVTLKAGFRIFAGINDEFLQPAAAGHRDVLAPRAVTRFAAALARHFGVGDPQSRVRAAGKYSRNIGMTIKASLVPDESRAFDLQRGDDFPVGGTGIKQQNKSGSTCAQRACGQYLGTLQHGLAHGILRRALGVAIEVKNDEFAICSNKKRPEKNFGPRWNKLKNQAS